MLAALKRHWPEYLIEAALLGAFMLSAATFGSLLEHPGSPVRQAVDDPFLRRIPMGVAMGLTAALLIYSPWGQRSGAHFNPAVTLTFGRLGKVAPWDQVFYVAAQFGGGLAGLLLAAILLGDAVSHPTVSYVKTVPGAAGPAVAFLAEIAIAFGLMMVVLVVSNTPRIARLTGAACGVLVALYIAFEAPLSGMSVNPARTVASAVPAGDWTHLWIYCVAPLAGMLLAAAIYLGLTGARGVMCAKLQHPPAQRCIFRCGYRGDDGQGMGVGDQGPAKHEQRAHPGSLIPGSHQLAPVPQSRSPKGEVA